MKRCIKTHNTLAPRSLLLRRPRSSGIIPYPDLIPSFSQHLMISFRTCIKHSNALRSAWISDETLLLRCLIYYIITPFSTLPITQKSEEFPLFSVFSYPHSGRLLKRTLFSVTCIYCLKNKIPVTVTLNSETGSIHMSPVTSLAQLILL